MRLVTDAITESDVAMTTHAMLLPDDQRAWVEAIVGRDLVELVSDVAERTETGWPVRIVITRASDGWRAHAFYAFFEHAAIAVIRARSRDAIERCLAALRSGRPRWTDDIAALADLWDLEDPVGLL